MAYIDVTLWPLDEMGEMLYSVSCGLIGGSVALVELVGWYWTDDMWLYLSDPMMTLSIGGYAIMYMDQVIKVYLSCYQVLLSTDSKTR